MQELVDVHIDYDAIEHAVEDHSRATVRAELAKTLAGSLVTKIMGKVDKADANRLAGKYERRGKEFVKI